MPLKTPPRNGSLLHFRFPENAGGSSIAPRRASIPRPPGLSCGACARPAAGRIARSFSSPTMPSTTTRACTRPGARPRSRTSWWRSCPLQSGAQSDRTRLETGPAALPAQPLLPRPGAGVGGGGRAFRPVGARQSGPGEIVCGCLRCASIYDAVYSRTRAAIGDSAGPGDSSIQSLVRDAGSIVSHSSVRRC